MDLLPRKAVNGILADVADAFLRSFNPAEGP